MSKQQDPAAPVSKSYRQFRAARRVAAVFGIVAIVSCAVACGPDTSKRPTESKTRQTSADPQELIKTATKNLKDAGTGSYFTEVTSTDPEADDFRATMFGEFDLDKRAHSSEMTTFPPDLPEGFTVRTRIFKNETFARVSAGPFRKCWMRTDASSLAAAYGIEDPSSTQVSDLIATTPWATRILDSAVGSGFATEDTSVRINAQVNLQAAFGAAMPKAANLLNEEIADEDLTVSAVLTVVDGKYLAATYTSDDLLRSAEIGANDLKNAGLTGEGLTPMQAMEIFSSLKVRIAYEGLGQPVKIPRPDKDEVADVDLATMSPDDTITCKASER